MNLHDFHAHHEVKADAQTARRARRVTHCVPACLRGSVAAMISLTPV